MVDTFLSHNAPVRLGFVFSMSGERKLTGLQDPSVAIVCAFNYVVQSYDGEDSNKKGFAFLKDVSLFLTILYFSLLYCAFPLYSTFFDII